MEQVTGPGEWQSRRRQKSTQPGCRDRHPTASKQAFDQVTCCRWERRGECIPNVLKAETSICDVRLIPVTSREWAHRAYSTCKFSHKRPGRATRLSRCRFIESVSGSSHDQFIANPFSVQCINHYSVDYKRGVLEILLNRKKALIRFSLLSFIFPSAPCGLTYVLKQAW